MSCPSSLTYPFPAPENMVNCISRVDVVSEFLDVPFSSSREHGHVQDGSNSGDHHGDNLEFACSWLRGHSSGIEVKGGHSHADQTDQQGGVTKISDVIVGGTWVAQGKRIIL